MTDDQLPELTDDKRRALDAMDMTAILGTWQERYGVAMNAAKRFAAAEAELASCKERLHVPTTEALHDEMERLRQLEIDLRGLIRDSDGVAGLHLNGDLAPWSELVPGGNYGIWLAHFKEREDG